MELRDYQKRLRDRVFDAWQSGAVNVCAVLPTGAGKTVLFSHIVGRFAASCMIAHRQELVCQISLALARYEVPHRIIGPKNVIKLCVSVQIAELGVSYYDPGAGCAVAGVDTLIRRRDKLAAWLPKVELWVMDEAHHVLRKNKWGAAVDMFPNARGLGVTATPVRADGCGLGRHADGFFDRLLVGMDMRGLIGRGYLTDYRIFAPPSDIHLEDVTISKATGDYNPVKLKTAVRRSKVVGDVVSHYLKIAPGRLGVTFATDVETAGDIADKFTAAGVPAAVVSAKTPDRERIATIAKFKNRQLLQLVNVDLFGEGFDLPAIEVVSMARPTQSYGLYVQQFGRALRPLEGKTEAIIIDHVGNVRRHGLPDGKREWSLERRERRAKKDDHGAIPVRVCTACTAVYERALLGCPYCGHLYAPARRDSIEFVDGDLHELDPAVLAAMRGEVDRVDMDAEDYRAELAAKHAPKIGQMAHVKRHVERQEAQRVLRDSIALWAGYQRAAGRPDRESYKRFFLKFGVDVLSAQALGRSEAQQLTERINNEFV